MLVTLSIEVKVKSELAALSKRHGLTVHPSLNRHICNGWKTDDRGHRWCCFRAVLDGPFCSREKEVVLFCLASTPIVFRSKH